MHKPGSVSFRCGCCSHAFGRRASLAGTAALAARGWVFGTDAVAVAWRIAVRGGRGQGGSAL